MKYFFLVSLLFAIIFAEPSAFSAGDLSARVPYGLNKTEKFILANKKKINRLSLKISKLQEKLETISNLFLTTTSKINNDISSINKNIKNIKIELSGEIAKLEQNISSKSELNAENIEQLKQILLQLTSLTREINSKYIDKDVMIEYVKKANTQKKYKKNIKKPRSLKKMSKSELLKKGESLMNKKKYSKAKPIFYELIKRGYRASRSNYYLGEIYFYNKQYRQALLFYKKSVKLYSKSYFMPNLLLHSALSSKYIGNKKNAKAFLQSLVTNFPKSKEAIKAKKLLVKY